MRRDIRVAIALMNVLAARRKKLLPTEKGTDSTFSSDKGDLVGRIEAQTAQYGPTALVLRE